MRRTILKKVVAKVLVASLAVGAISFTGCGKADDAEGVTTLIVGSDNAWEPYAYLDENGEPAGFEYEVMRAIDEVLPQYEFQYEPSTFDNVILSLDAGKIDIAVDQLEYSDERAEQYLFAEVPYTVCNTYIVVLTDDDTTQSLEDLAGETVLSVGATSASTLILQKWNEEHPGQEINLVYTAGGTYEALVASLKNGSIKAYIDTKRGCEQMNEYFGEGTDFLKIVGEPINATKTYFMYQKGNTELQKELDEALQTLLDDGTISALSIEYLGDDYTEKE